MTISPGSDRKTKRWNLSIILSILAVIVSVLFSALTVYYQFLHIDERIVLRISDAQLHCQEPICHFSVELALVNPGDYPALVNLRVSLGAQREISNNLQLNLPESIEGPHLMQPKQIMRLVYDSEALARPRYSDDDYVHLTATAAKDLSQSEFYVRVWANYVGGATALTCYGTLIAQLHYQQDQSWLSVINRDVLVLDTPTIFSSSPECPST